VPTPWVPRHGWRTRAAVDPGRAARSCPEFATTGRFRRRRWRRPPYQPKQERTGARAVARDLADDAGEAAACSLKAWKGGLRSVVLGGLPVPRGADCRISEANGRGASTRARDEPCETQT